MLSSVPTWLQEKRKKKKRSPKPTLRNPSKTLNTPNPPTRLNNNFLKITVTTQVKPAGSPAPAPPRSPPSRTRASLPLSPRRPAVTWGARKDPSAAPAPEAPTSCCRTHRNIPGGAGRGPSGGAPVAVPRPPLSPSPSPPQASCPPRLLPMAQRPDAELGAAERPRHPQPPRLPAPRRRRHHRAAADTPRRCGPPPGSDV